MSVVLDASAVLAFLGSEAGADVVEAYLAGGALVSAVNLAEVVTKLCERGMPLPEVKRTVADLNVEVVAFTEVLAYLAGDLRRHTLQAGLSLGDRACLALGLHQELPVLTSDSAWSALETLPGLRVEQIR